MSGAFSDPLEGKKRPIEYDIYPYSESTQRILALQRRAGGRRLTEETI
jgi:hypothetical protein